MNNIDSENKTDSRKLRLKVLTPMRVVCDREVDMIIARTVDGDMGVLYGHESRSVLLSDGALRIFTADQERKEELLMVLGGILTINGNDAVILSDIAESPDKMQEYIDRMRAERADNKVKEQTTELTTQRMELAIRQALVHMDVSAYPMLNKVENPQSEQ